MDPKMLIAAGAVLGAIIGSFIATLAVRWPEGASVAEGRSLCDGCGAPIAPVRLIPLVSYALQRGRAVCCGTAIDRVHPIAELLAAAIGGLSFAIADGLGEAIAGAVLGWLLLALALLDARRMWLPDRLTAALALGGLAAGVAGLPPGLSDRLIGGLAGFLSFALVRHGYRLLRHREGMGGGDVKLFGAIGLWLGWRVLPFVLLTAAVAGLLWALLQFIRQRPVTARSTVPFGCFLALAGWGCWLAQEAGWAASAHG